MKLLMISNDKKILNPQSNVAKRQVEYAKKYEEVHILLRGPKKEISLSQNLWVYSRLWRYNLGRFLIEKRGLTHITCQDPFENGLIGVLLKKRTNVFLELQLHTDLDAQNWFRRFLAKYNLAFADHVRVVSNRLKEQVSRYVDKTKIEVRPIFVDIEKIKNAPKIPHEKKTLLCISRLEPEKQVHMAIKAMRSIKDAELKIVGDGSQRKKLEKLAEGLPVTFYGWTEETIPFYKSADIFINTSKYEGYGMTLVEAQAAGLKILSTDVGVAREVGAIIIKSVEDIVKNV